MVNDEYGFGTSGQIMVAEVEIGADTSGARSTINNLIDYFNQQEKQLIDKIDAAEQYARSVLSSTVRIIDAFNILFQTSIETQWITLALSAEAAIRHTFISLQTALATPWGWETVPLILGVFAQWLTFLAWAKQQQEYTQQELQRTRREEWDTLFDLS